ncbi:putative quinol monooxygenase [Bacillus pumilus]|uniref:putative quinol monooxygenase n=1 Tax=Bacillus pumilus TaxID=1408 RepID=UPI0011E92254|nr:putative quinol monooxygenase [Bacillus pumilus]TYS31316.1 antibiotic biosynthesis monooxygenase [Bacillus pumilus]TYS46465.1 antibiotic biosynthesis monooxygenase [Bacillus pumilus]
MIITHAGMTIHPEKENEFLEEINALMKASREEEGNVSYKLFKDTEKENTFLMVEVWKDEAAVQSHNTSAHFQSFVAKAKEFLAAPLDVVAFKGEQLS